MTYIWTGYSAKVIANYFLEMGKMDGVPIDPLKLQKLIYLAHGWSLFFLQRRLISEPFQAWRYGPVVPTLYKEFQRFGGSPVNEPAQGDTPQPSYGLDEDTRSLLDAVWTRYKSLSPIQLSALTHEPGYAWDLARRTGSLAPWGGPIIPDELIQDEFARRQRQSR